MTCTTSLCPAVVHSFPVGQHPGGWLDLGIADCPPLCTQSAARYVIIPAMSEYDPVLSYIADFWPRIIRSNPRPQGTLIGNDEVAAMVPWLIRVGPFQVELVTNTRLRLPVPVPPSSPPAFVPPAEFTTPP